jgi:Ca2+-transporting ATPase
MPNKWAGMTPAMLAAELDVDLDKGLGDDEVKRRQAIHGPNTLGKEQQTPAEETPVLETRVMRNGKEDTVPARDLVPGDIVLLSAGDAVPSDGRLLELEEIMTNEANITGVPEDVKKVLVLTGEELDEEHRKYGPISRNMCFAATVVTKGTGKLIITSTGMETQVGAIFKALHPDLLQEQKQVRKVQKVQKHLLLAAAIVAPIGFLIGVGVLIGQSTCSC